MQIARQAVATVLSRAIVVPVDFNGSQTAGERKATTYHQAVSATAKKFLQSNRIYREYVSGKYLRMLIANRIGSVLGRRHL